MPVRSRYTHQATRQKHRQTTAEPPKEPPKDKRSFLSNLNPALVKTKNALVKVGKYIQTNQDAHRKAGITPIDEDLRHFAGRVSNRTAEFGAEQGREIQRSCRPDPDEQLLRDLQGQRRSRNQPQPGNRIEFEISHPQQHQQTQQTAHRPAKRKPTEKVVERIIYVPTPPPGEGRY